ncbi:unnamed protein product [Orchesella dallaii]|uniref:DOMON domain-containing protein n=1 Tax=Orchesella dallaii TaxID=48710 RepID=A0ABP1PNI2_9HEXA
MGSNYVPSLVLIFLINVNTFCVQGIGFRKASLKNSWLEKGDQTQDENPYRHSLTLDPRGRYRLEWEVDWKNERVVFNVTVATNGYIGFGLSRKGKMSGADIVIGGVDNNGKPYFSDRHAIGNQLPIRDQSQDWILQEAWERGALTFLSFSRNFDTCDKVGDLVIDENLVSVIWAYSERDDEIQYHFENKGAYDLYLLDPDLTPQSLVDGGTSGGQMFRISEQLTLPPRDTLYYCSFHRAPTTTKHHVIGFNVDFPTDQDRRMVHHLLLYRCTAPQNSPSFQTLLQSSQSGGGECFPDQGIGPPGTGLCRDLIFAWGVGGRPIFFPNHVGSPISESGPQILLLQVHYDNPNVVTNITNTINLDVYYTQNLRENEASVFTMGGSVPGATNIIIPPSSLDHVINGHCAPGCTEGLFPPEGINIFAAFHHTHATGRDTRLRHFRNGKELPWILSDDNYNFSYQQNRLLRKERNVLPGDQLVQRCVHDSTQGNGTVVTGGYSTREEMCLAFLYYYNRIPGAVSCLSGVRTEEYRNLLGIRNTTFNRNLTETIITDPLRFAGLTVSNYTTNYIDWDIELREELQRHHLLSPQISVCPVFPVLTDNSNNPAGIVVNEEESILPQGRPEYKPESRCRLGYGGKNEGGWRNSGGTSGGDGNRGKLDDFQDFATSFQW